jgi:pimeloyl-ACP methyl ester carboxylesterase
MEFITEELLVRFGDTYGTMVVRIWDPPGSKATVFCIHGFEGNGSDFGYLAGILAKAGFKVVCPDLVGRGASTYFGQPRMYSIDTYLTCIGTLSKYAGDKNHFVGTSWGGAIVLYFLCLTRVKADKLILNDVGMRNNAAIYEILESLDRESKEAFDTLAEAEAYVRRSRYYLGTFADELWPGYLKNKIRLSDGKYRLTYDPAAVSISKESLEKPYDLFPLLEKIEGEILLLYGVDSKCYEASTVADLMQRHPRISCVPDLKSGHPPSLMTYEQALLIRGFLAA